jgi:hypothetical protein
VQECKLTVPNTIYGKTNCYLYFDTTTNNYNLEVRQGGILANKSFSVVNNKLYSTNTSSNTISQLYQDSNSILQIQNPSGNINLSSNGINQMQINNTGLIFSINDSVYTSAEGQTGFQIKNQTNTNNLYFGVNSSNNTYSYIQSSKTGVGNDDLILNGRGGNLHLGY